LKRSFNLRYVTIFVTFLIEKHNLQKIKKKCLRSVDLHTCVGSYDGRSPRRLVANPRKTRVKMKTGEGVQMATTGLDEKSLKHSKK
jgi:hypothetical protein